MVKYKNVLVKDIEDTRYNVRRSIKDTMSIKIPFLYFIMELVPWFHEMDKSNVTSSFRGNRKCSVRLKKNNNVCGIFSNVSLEFHHERLDQVQDVITLFLKITSLESFWVTQKCLWPIHPTNLLKMESQETSMGSEVNFTTHWYAKANETLFGGYPIFCRRWNWHGEGRIIYSTLKA